MFPEERIWPRDYVFSEVSGQENMPSAVPPFMKRHLMLLVLIASIAMAYVALSSWRYWHRVRHATQGIGGQIRGQIVTAMLSGDLVALPEIDIFARNLDTGKETPKVQTDDEGRFLIKRQPPGEYEICWSSTGWIAGCTKDKVNLSNGTAYPPLIALSGISAANTRLVEGRLVLLENALCNFSDEAFGYRQFGRIDVFDIQQDHKLIEVMVNARGEFVIPGLPADRSLKLTGICNRGTTVRSLSPGGTENIGDLVIQNHRPKIASVRAMLGRKSAISVRPGQELTFLADVQDPDKKPLQIRWQTSAGAFTTQEGSVAKWIAPNHVGVSQVFLLSYDEDGGISSAAYTIRVGGPTRQLGGRFLAAGTGSSLLSPANINLPDGVPPWEGYPNTAPFLTLRDEGTPQNAARYYKAVDPQQKRLTLGDWWRINGFQPTTGVGGTRAAYLNFNDLGFGRDMHCVRVNADIACYVTNYGGFDQNIANADLAVRADKSTALATVAMEYSRIEGHESQNPIVKFFIFEGGTPEAKRIDSVPLDPFGKKFLPNLCLNCHGGTFEPGTSEAPDDLFKEADLGASFREFDLASFRYSQQMSREQQENAFLELNKMVLDTHPSSAIETLINNWYAGGRVPQDSSFVPRDWQAQPQLYSTVVANSCRTCHVALQRTNDNGTISWAAFSQFVDEKSNIKELVCKSAKIMPHSYITYLNFWRSANPRLPDQLATFTGWGQPFGSCK